VDDVPANRRGVINVVQLRFLYDLGIYTTQTIGWIHLLGLRSLFESTKVHVPSQDLVLDGEVSVL
jgi:hypothetical protein